MPTYAYRCSCGYDFTILCKYDQRLDAEEQPCPSCGEKKVNYMISAPKIVSDVGSLGALGKTDAGWKEVLSKVKSELKVNNIKT